MAKVLLGRRLWVLPTCTVVCKSYHSLSENHFCGCKKGLITLNHCTEVRFASFLSGGFTTMAVINPPERKLIKRTSVHWFKILLLICNVNLADFHTKDLSYQSYFLQIVYFFEILSLHSICYVRLFLTFIRSTHQPTSAINSTVNQQKLSFF